MLKKEQKFKLFQISRRQRFFFTLHVRLAQRVILLIQPVKTYYRGKHTIKQIRLIMQPMKLTITQEYYYIYCSSLAAKLLFNGFVVVSSHATPIDLLQLNVMHHCNSIFTGSNCVLSETLKKCNALHKKRETDQHLLSGSSSSISNKILWSKTRRSVVKN